MLDSFHAVEQEPRIPSKPTHRSNIRFGSFELNVRTAELRKNGSRIRLQEQPFQILSMLLDRPGEVVTRDEIRDRLWPDGTVVEFDHSINAAVKRLRDALRDSADNPRYIETLARRGYRFIGLVEGEDEATPMESLESVLTEVPVQIEIPTQSSGRLEAVRLSSSRMMPRNTVPRLAWAMGTIGLGALLGWWTFHLSSGGGDAPSPPVVNSMLLPSHGAQFDVTRNPLALPALSPDGAYIVFGMKTDKGKHRLWLRRLDSGEAQLLPDTEDGIFPFWSPDSRWVGFGQGTMLRKINIHGGPPLLIAKTSQPIRGATWSAAGVIVFGLTGSPASLFKTAAAGGGPVIPATAMEPGVETAGHRYPWFLPDGRHFLYTSQQSGDIPVRVGSLDEPGKPGKIVAKADSFVRFAQGNLLFLRDDTLMAQPFDTSRLQTTGEALPLAKGVLILTQPSRAAAFTVSGNGMLVYQSSTEGPQSSLIWKDRQGKVLSSVGTLTGRIDGISVSDANRVVVTHRERTGNTSLWTYDPNRGVLTRFADAEHFGWSSDGDTLYFQSDRLGHPALFRRTSRTGAEELVVDGPARPASISQDGKLLLYTRPGESAGSAPALLIVPLGPKERITSQPAVFLQTPGGARSAQFSPDRFFGGRWITWGSNESGQPEVYAAPFPGPGGKQQISSGGAQLQLWSHDGKELFYVDPEGQLIAAELRVRGATLEMGRQQKLFRGVITAGDRGMTYGTSADGQKFLVVQDEVAVDALPLTLIQNWPSALRK